MNQVKYISASQLSMFQECPRQWYYRYVMKYPTEEQVDTRALDLGNAVHKVLELSLIATQKNHPKYSNPMSLIESAIKKYNVTPELAKLLPDLIANATKLGWFKNYDDAKTEFKVKYPIDDFVISMKIDRLHLDSGRRVIDLKTGKWVMSAENAAKSWQSKLYALPYLSLGDVDVEYWFIRFVTATPRTRVFQKEKEQIISNVRDEVDKMRRADGETYHVTNLCDRFCPYFNKCKENR